VVVEGIFWLLLTLNVVFICFYKSAGLFDHQCVHLDRFDFKKESHSPVNLFILHQRLLDSAAGAT